MVGGWIGTDDDDSTELLNTLAMPGSDHVAAVVYAKECFALSLNHTGLGADPSASPLGDGTAWLEHPVDEDINGSFSVFAADVDGDGDLDVLGAAGFPDDDVTWWENFDGNGTIWIEHTIDGSFEGARSVYAADVDGDGNLDVLGAASEADEIAWWKNTAGDGSVWTEHVVDDAFNGAKSVYAADVDGDGDVDVLGAAGEGCCADDDITWWENTTGNGTVWAEHIVDGDFRGAVSVYSGDVDGDGDLDVLGGARVADDITWWENTTGDGTVWVEHGVDDDFERRPIRVRCGRGRRRGPGCAGSGEHADARHHLVGERGRPRHNLGRAHGRRTLPRRLVGLRQGRRRRLGHRCVGCFAC